MRVNPHASRTPRNKPWSAPILPIVILVLTHLYTPAYFLNITLFSP